MNLGVGMGATGEKNMQQDKAAEGAVDFFKIVETSPQAISLHQQGQLRYANPACRKLFAVDQGTAITNLSVRDFVLPEDQETVTQRISAIINSGQRLGCFEQKLRRLNGQVFDAEIQVAPMGDSAQGLLQVVMQDISGRKTAERAIYSSEARYRAIVEGLPNLVFVIRDGLLEYVNARSLKILGYSRAGLFAAPRPFAELLEESSRSRFFDAMERLALGRSSAPFVAHLRQLRGDALAVLLAVELMEPERRGPGEALQVLAVATELTPLDQNDNVHEKGCKRLARELEGRQHQLVQSQKELDAFVYSVSHDLRAPLHHITGFTDATLDEFGDVIGNEGRRYLERALGSVEHMTTLIDALLRLSRLSRAELKKQSLDLGGLCQAVFFDLQQQWKKSAELAALPMQLLVEPDLRAYGDSNLLRLVVENLLDNAIKFSVQTGAVEIWVERVDISEEKKENQLEQQAFVVRDHGVGFDPAQLDRLFAPFQRLHNKTDYPGLGIGLATARRVITRHGGRIWAESNPGEGASFFFTLPDAPDFPAA